MQGSLCHKQPKIRAWDVEIVAPISEGVAVKPSGLRQSLIAPSLLPPSRDHAGYLCTHQTSYQYVLPTEVWRLILELLPKIELFSLYNTSTYMRSLSAPLLVQVVASKSLRLYFYQEYIPRVGIEFDFDHFDLERDRVVFRPQIADHQHRFKCGLTLQNPQLEEVAVKSCANPVIAPHQIDCSDGRFFTVRDYKTTSLAVTATAAATTTESSGTFISAFMPVQAEVADTAVVMETLEGRRHEPHKQTADEKGYRGTKNFLDKTCPVHIRKDGPGEVNGARYCFLKGYPWSLHYQVAYEPFDTHLNTEAHMDKTNHGNHITPRKREQFFFDIRDDLRTYSPQTVEGVQANANTNAGGSDNDREDDDVPPYIIQPSSQSKWSKPAGAANENSKTTTGKGVMSNGPRYLRILRFECSMNFLDPKRATRNIIGRWLEGKMQHWKDVLGGKKHQQIAAAAGTSESINNGTAKSSNSNKAIHVIDAILGGPRPAPNRNSSSNHGSPSSGSGYVRDDGKPDVDSTNREQRGFEICSTPRSQPKSRDFGSDLTTVEAF
ncbi:hypothetical protein EDD21DRAFT_349612 [Dissophora ornata]|nr:hypothetical protein BGZ58_010085 [Dissophora ornata]KAI8605895.1 hypothetical protein EDD21DRAFT_349612 [Dissophora ornata]